MNNPKYLKMLKHFKTPIPTSGPILAPSDRSVVWKRVCRLGAEKLECLVEMSFTKTKFYITALDL